MNKQLVEQIILEELETLSEMGELDEGFFDDLMNRLRRAESEGQTQRSSTSSLFKRYRSLQRGKKIVADRERTEKLMLALGADDLPANLVTDKPIPLDITNPPILLDPITQYQVFKFVWDYDVADGKKPKKRRLSNAAGAKLFYDESCRSGLKMYCSDRWFRVEQEAEEVESDPEAPIVDSTPDKSDVPLSIYKRQKDEPSLRNAQGTVEMPLVTYMQKKLNLGPKAAQRILKGIAGTLKSRNIPIAESKLANLVVVTEETTETFFKRRGTPVKFDPRDYGKFLKRLSKDREKLKASIPELEKELEDAKKNPAYMGANIQLAQQALTRIKKQLGDFEKDAEAGVAKQKGMKADQKAKRKEIEAKAKKMPLVGRVLMTYAARSGSRAGEYDKAFFKALGDDKQQNKIIKSIEKILRRQMRRRGYDDSQIKSALKEGMFSGVLTESRETSIIRDTIKEIKKERLF
tara:strand:- start:2483 stop:3871 length:1389 start_codon:yes stop_codon:yes gene_type:complete